MSVITTTTSIRPTKAKFTCLDNAAFSIDEVPFNPASFSITRSVNWNSYGAKRVTWSGMDFDMGENDMLDMALLLDESEGGTFAVPNTASVLTAAQAFYTLSMPMAISTTEIRPPVVLFLWELVRFQGVMKMVKVDFTLFAATGAPKRAMVTIQMIGQAFQTATTADEVILPALPTPTPAVLLPSTSYYGKPE